MSDKPGKNPDTWLEDESTVSRAYGGLKKTLPPAHLDDLILAEARRATASLDTTVIRVQRWRKWTMPAALAATVVFAVPLVIRVFDNSPGLDTNLGKTVTTMETAANADLAVANRAVAAEAKSATPAEDELVQAMPDDQRREVSERLLDHLKSAGASDGLENVGFVTQPRMDSKTDSALRSDSAATPADKPSSDIATTNAAPAPVVAAETWAIEPRLSTPPASFRDEAADTSNTLATEATTQPAAASATPAVTPSMREVTPSADTERQRRNTKGFAMRAPTVAEISQQVSGIEEIVISGSRIDPEPWLDDIARQHRDGRVRAARVGLGSFLTEYPDYELPDDFPLQAKDALFENGEAGEIVPEAESWLRGIGMMAQRGETDQARTQLAEFFRIFPDYLLPPDFPLTREDALLIER